MIKIFYITYFFLFNFINQEVVNTYNSDNYNYSWKVNYSENCFLPFTDSEIAMLNDVFVDNLDTYVLDKPNRALDIKDILRNRVNIYKEEIKDISNYPLLSSVGLFNIFNNNETPPVFDKDNFNPLIYNFEFGSKSRQVY
ncbi:MAG: hypothetical protein L7S44_05495 [Flavobacteriaceae bacterium]|nr:hypothetical protein [Flavobacteriaceae bacterium]